ncbi:hypothetical protein BKM03_19425 [Pseudomonas avellanae]|uniref:Uncharacterized protein n=1 Tax=Pseudomonas avellanae TaxID=46257 RepID=A0AAD0E099_9PSED|nr:hypothetical protein BKM03_19425 [Pseudomonas avellanae]POP85451.1 hypothetical protein CXB34_16965 [Pseudomonas amygdali pv. morsprunorum]
MRSGPETGDLGCICCTEASGFAAGSRQFADKSAPTKKREIANQRSVARSAHITRFCPEGVGADLSAKGCEAALKPVTPAVSDTSRRLVLLQVPGSSRTSEASPGPLLQSLALRRWSERPLLILAEGSDHSHWSEHRTPALLHF